MKTINIKSIFTILFMGILLAGCNSSHDGHDHGGHDDHEDHGGHDDHEEGVVSLTPQQMGAIGLELVHLEKRNLNVGIQVTGQLELFPQDKADVSPMLGGVIKDIKVIEGDKVKRGQVLATMQHPDFIQLQQDYINSINTLEYLEKNFIRQKKLYDEKVGSGKEFQQVQAEYLSKKSVVRALEIKLNMIGLNAQKIADGTLFAEVAISSPMDGVVSLVETNIGSYVEPLTKLFEIVNNSKLHADFRVYEKDINKIKLGQKIFFTTSSLLGEEFEGEIFAISPVFEESPKALHIHAEISENESNLIQGMYIHGRLIADNISTTVLPEHSVVTDNEKTYIFVKADDDHTDHTDHADHADHDEAKVSFEMVEVITGFTSEGYIEVKLLSPLHEDAEVVGNGAYYLLAEKDKGETEHTH